MELNQTGSKLIKEETGIEAKNEDLSFELAKLEAELDASRKKVDLAEKAFEKMEKLYSSVRDYNDELKRQINFLTIELHNYKILATTGQNHIQSVNNRECYVDVSTQYELQDVEWQQSHSEQFNTDADYNPNAFTEIDNCLSISADIIGNRSTDTKIGTELVSGTGQYTESVMLTELGTELVSGTKQYTESVVLTELDSESVQCNELGSESVWYNELGGESVPCNELGGESVPCSELGGESVQCNELGGESVWCNELGGESVVSAEDKPSESRPFDEQKSLANSLKEAAESFVAQSNFVYDPQTRMYYDTQSGYYYDAVSITKHSLVYITML